MPDSGSVSISDAGWVKWLAGFTIATGKNFREALYEEWPLLMRKVMDFTPPFKVRNAPSTTDLSVGRGAVAKDVYKVMRPFDPKEIRTPMLRRIVERRDVVAFNAMAARSASPYLQDVEALPFSPELHIAARNARGRVPGKPRGIVVLGTDADALKKYVKLVQGHVGWAKSGWLKALLLVGGQAPGYVANKGTGGGDVIDDHANEDEPSITAINRTPWAVRKDEGERILSDAKASRIESIIAKTKNAVLRSVQEANDAA